MEKPKNKLWFSPIVGQGEGLSLEGYHAAGMRYLERCSALHTRAQVMQTLGRVHRSPRAQRLVFNPTIEESHVRPILERKLASLNFPSATPYSKPKTMKSINTKTATRAQLVREIHHLRREIEIQHTDAKTVDAQLYALRQKYDESEGARRDAGERVTELTNERKNLRQCVQEFAKITKSLAEVIEHL